MKHFIKAPSQPVIEQLAAQALQYKAQPLLHQQLGQGKTLGLIFLNPSLRTRLSTIKAGRNLGLEVMAMDIDREGWALELRDNVVMNGTTVEHVREAARVLGAYVDILGIRCFPGLKDRDADYQEQVLNQFLTHTGRPILSLESGTRHPLQSLADVITIKEQAPLGRKPKVVLAWAPHIKPLPQAVPNSFAEWMLAAGHDLTIAHPPGYDLHPDFTQGAQITHDLDAAVADADFIYVKNWSAYEPYGAVTHAGEGWLLTEDRLKQSPQARIMHCLPVRRDLELSGHLLDGPRSLVIEQAGNRVWAAQAVLSAQLQGFDFEAAPSEFPQFERFLA